MKNETASSEWLLYSSFFTFHLILILFTGSSGSNIHDWVNQPVVVLFFQYKLKDLKLHEFSAFR
jgi:hypothetical protein